MAVLIFRNDKVLMLKRKGAHGDGTWSVPGGALEFGEDFETGARREVKEEVGIEIGEPEVLAVTSDVFKEEKQHWITMWFTAVFYGDTEPSICEPEKMSELGWFNPEELPHPLFLPWKNLLKIVSFSG